MNEFRFLVMCRKPSRDGEVVTLHDVVNTITVPADGFPCDVKMYAVVGAVVMREMWDKHLDLMAWEVGRTGQRETLVGYRGTPLIIPREIGAICMPYQITIPATQPGFYGFDLFDREGVFGAPAGLLATYLYSIREDHP